MTRSLKAMGGYRHGVWDHQGDESESAAAHALRAALRDASRDSHDGAWASSAAAGKVMRGNQRRDTKPELEVRRILHAQGVRYRVDLPLTFDRRRRADIAFTKVRLAVFVDGCFWHGCPVHYISPATNPTYWEAKVARNRERDMETAARLEQSGWTVLRLWEHEDPRKAAELVQETVARLRAADHGVRGQGVQTRGHHQAPAALLRHPGTRDG
jgi:DNA mismatch endonuclease (patch repair protein)